jgi:SHS2 domain-containing protein
MEDKRYFQIEHPSDVGIRVYGKNMENLFENAAIGMFSLMCDIARVRQMTRRKLFIKNDNVREEPEDLLVLWLEKLIYIYEVEKMLFSRFNILQIENKDKNKLVRAEIYGERIDLKRHVLLVSIKAPTYHKLYVKKDKNRDLWNAQIVFDV